MNLKQENRHIVDVLFVLALFCVFAISALMLVMLGANVYQKTVNNMDDNYNSRTAFSYITEKIRQNDTSSAVSVGTLEGRPAILLSQEIDGKPFTTYLYEYDGYLTELFTGEGTNLGSDILKAGHPLIPLKNFTLTEITPSLYRFILTTEDTGNLTLYISTQSEKISEN